MVLYGIHGIGGFSICWYDTDGVVLDPVEKYRLDGIGWDSIIFNVMEMVFDGSARTMEVINPPCQAYAFVQNHHKVI